MAGTKGHAVTSRELMKLSDSVTRPTAGRGPAAELMPVGGHRSVTSSACCDLRVRARSVSIWTTWRVF